LIGLLTCSSVAEPDKGKGKENDEDENMSRSSEPTDSDASGSDNRYDFKGHLSFQYLPSRDADTSKAFVVAEEEKFVGGARKQLSRREIAKSQEGIVRTASALLVWLKSTAHLAGTAECLGHDLHLSQDHSTGTQMECLTHLLLIQLS
jgi:hypothetical protein